MGFINHYIAGGPKTAKLPKVAKFYMVYGKYDMI